jgi:hypothetical protein
MSERRGLTFQCVTCRREFEFSLADQIYFEAMGQQEPQRCIECRQAHTTRKLNESFKQAVERDMSE